MYMYIIYIYIHTCNYIYMYTYIYICPGCQVSRSLRGGSHRMGFPTEWNMHAMHAYACICTHSHECTHLHVHIYICMHCVCMQAYTCMACMRLHMHAWHACIYSCLMPCAPPHHTHRGALPLMSGGPAAVYDMGTSTVHPTSHRAGGASPSLHPHPL